MAEYQNLTTLAGLQAGDVVYIRDVTSLAIDMAGCKVKLEVSGNGFQDTNKRDGGYSVGTTVNKINGILYFSYSKESSSTFSTKPYGTANWLYSRILVAGDGGYASTTTYKVGNTLYRANGGYGGGSTGGSGSIGENYNNVTPSSGGTQTSGGKIPSSNAYAADGVTQKNGGFGIIGQGGIRTTNDFFYPSFNLGYGGGGWYGGACGYAQSSSTSGFAGAGGGSGYVLTDTSEKPAGYISDWELYKMDNTKLVRSGATSSSYGQAFTLGARITIIEAGAGASGTTIQYYNGSEFIESEIYYYDGSEFKRCDVFVFDGNEFKKGG